MGGVKEENKETEKQRENIRGKTSQVTNINI